MDVWYQSLEKNLSTMSTTPIDISAILQSKKHHMGAEFFNGVNDDEAFAHRNTVYTLVSERPFTPSLSQNCSISVFTNNPMKSHNGELLAQPGQSTSKQHHRHIHAHHLSSEEASSHREKEVEASIELQHENPPLTLPVLKNNEDCVSVVVEKIIEEEEDEVSDEEALSSEQGNPSVTAQSQVGSGSTCPIKYGNPTSSVRSSTLATIHEESESTKGSPGNTKAASPASGYMTPDENVSPQETQTKLCPSMEDNKIAHCPSQNTNQNTFNNNYSDHQLQPDNDSLLKQ